MSTPKVLRGEVAGSSTRGMASVTLVLLGKAMTRERGTVAARAIEALQARVVPCAATGELVELQAPADAAVVPLLAQHPQEAQPRVSRAEAEQQQPPRHWLEAQSEAVSQGSPGEKVAQVPRKKWQALQPRRAAVGVQQMPLRQAPEVQLLLLAHREPGGLSGGAGVGCTRRVAVGVGVVDRLGVALTEAPALSVWVGLGEGDGVEDGVRGIVEETLGVGEKLWLEDTEQALMSTEPMVSVLVPAGQGKHASLPTYGLYAPAAQGKQLIIESLAVSGLYVPGEQGKHEDRPLDGLYVPAAQDKHAPEEELPVDGLKVPAAQDRHALIKVLPVDGLNLPAGQNKHAPEEELPVDGLKVPAAQDRHALMEVLPDTGLKVPCEVKEV